MNSWNPNSTNKLSMLVCSCISKFIYCCLLAGFSLLSIISCICLSFYWLVWKSLQLTNAWIYKDSLYMISYVYQLFCKSLLYIHNADDDGWNMFRKLKSVVFFFKDNCFIWANKTVRYGSHLHFRNKFLFTTNKAHPLASRVTCVQWLVHTLSWDRFSSYKQGLNWVLLLNLHYVCVLFLRLAKLEWSNW